MTNMTFDWHFEKFIIICLIFGLIGVYTPAKAQTQASDSNYAVSAAMTQVLLKAASDSSFLSQDTLYVSLNLELEGLPTSISGRPIMYLRSNDIKMPDGVYLVIEVDSIVQLNSFSKLRFSILKLIVVDSNQTWVCCQGCSGGGYVLYEVAEDRREIEVKDQIYYNCF